MPQPLSNIFVLDFSTLLPGPMATLMLAEAGAEVLKVEKPGGEDMQRFEPRIGETSAPYAVLNRGKSILSLDLKSADAVATLRPLIERADVVVEQFRPGVMDRLGLGYEHMKAINPRIVYCSITGFGQKGPRSAQAGHDINYQALAGLLSLAPGTAEQPAVPPALVADIGGGAMPAVMNILLALRQRDLTGQGAWLDIAMTDAMFTFGWYGLVEGHATGRFPGAAENLLTGGSPRYAVYATSDARFLAVGALEQKFWNSLCEAIGLPGELRDDRKSPHATRVALKAIIGAQPSAYWQRLLDPLDCCCTIVASLEEALADPHFVQRGLFASTATLSDGGSLPAMVLPIDRQFRGDQDS